ncbi:hypothetical protein [Flavobacterium sp.]|uniref:hypothetical protein n=1 Tax=Flavobacterium sp. TaxID=239 RepID=UPI00374D7B29
MKIKEIENLVPQFSSQMLAMFGTTQSELASKTVQLGFKIVEGNSKTLNMEQTKKDKFWLSLHSNMELLKGRFLETYLLQNPTATNEQKTDAFFKYVDKETPKN